MKKRIIISIFFIVIMIFISRNKVQAKSYSIEDMDIEATINQDGSVSIEQEIEYEFKGTYNGVFLNIPYNLEDNEKKEIGNKNVLKESLYIWK